MIKTEPITQDGVVDTVLPDSKFRVKLQNGHEVLAYTSGRMKRNNIKIIAGDKVKIEIPPYDLNRGRVIYRYKPQGQ